jgi:hypothetical protein
MGYTVRPEIVVATFTQSVTRWHFRKAKFVQSCNIQFLNFFKEVFRTIFTPLKFVEMLLEGFSYALSIMVVNLNICNKI